MLARQGRERRRHAFAGRTVAGSTGRNVTIGNTGTPDFTATLNNIQVCTQFSRCGLGQGLLANINSQVLHVLRCHLSNRRIHHGWIALCIGTVTALGPFRSLEVLELVDDILIRHTGQAWIHGDHAVTGNTMTGHTGQNPARHVAIGIQFLSGFDIRLGGKTGCAHDQAHGHATCH